MASLYLALYYRLDSFSQTLDLCRERQRQRERINEHQCFNYHWYVFVRYRSEINNILYGSHFFDAILWVKPFHITLIYVTFKTTLLWQSEHKSIFSNHHEIYRQIVKRMLSLKPNSHHLLELECVFTTSCERDKLRLMSLIESHWQFVKYCMPMSYAVRRVHVKRHVQRAS